MLVEQLGPLGNPILRQRFAGAGTECRIGRDLDCDIVLDDEHAAPQHALLTLLEDGRVSVRDLGTKNGTQVDDERVPADVGAILEQGTVVIGRTRLRIRTRHVRLGPERIFRRDFARRHRTLLAAVGVAACIAYGGFHQWLDAPASLLRSAATAALVTLGVMALWTGPWALTTKLNKGSWEIRVHLAIASIGAAFCAWGYWADGLLAFAMQTSILDKVGAGVVAGIVLAALYLHLRHATHYGRRTALALAGTATLAIVSTAWVFAFEVEDDDVNRIDLGPDVRLGVERIVPNRDIADYQAETDELLLAAGRKRQESLLGAPLADADD